MILNYSSHYKQVFTWPECSVPNCKQIARLRDTSCMLQVRDTMSEATSVHTDNNFELVTYKKKSSRKSVVKYVTSPQTRSDSTNIDKDATIR